MKKKSKSADRTRCDTQVAPVSRRGDHKPVETHEMNVAMNSADQKIREDQKSPVSSGAASRFHNGNQMSIASKPRTNKRGRPADENHCALASSDPAIVPVKSTTAMRDHNSERVHAKDEIPRPLDSFHPAIGRAKPITLMLDDSFVGHGASDTLLSAANDAGQALADSQLECASEPLSDDYFGSEYHPLPVVAGDDHSLSENHPTAVIPKIQELWKNRQAWHRAEKSLTLQGKAQCRRFTEGDKEKANKLFASLEKVVDGGHIPVEAHIGHAAAAIFPFLEARTPLEAHRKLIEKELIKLAKSLPIYAWAEPIRGLGPLSIAAIVGCAGDLNNYATVSRLWKRMGLAVINGKRQRRVKDAIEALEHGFAPERAAVMFNISGGLIGGMGHGPRPKVGEDVTLRDDLSPYQKRFIELIRKEVERVTETWNGPEHKREPVEKKGEMYESYSSHAANRIRRRIAKEFLCDLIVAWKGLTKAHVKPNQPMSGPTLMEAAE